MPYSLVRDIHDKGYYIINTDTGKKHSKKPLSHKRALSQLRALYLNTHDIEGGGIGDYISNVFNKSNTNVVKKVREYGKLNVTGFAIHRSPVQKVLQKILKGISFGKFNPGSLGFDDVYHLFIVFRLGTPLYPNYVHYILSEKRPVLIMENRKDFASKTSNGDFIIDTDLQEPHITFEEMIMKTMNIMGSKFNTYDPVNNNCQTIIKAFVNSLGVHKYDDYIEQDVSSILTGITHKIAKGVTDIGHAFGRVFGGDELLNIDLGLKGGREILDVDTPKSAENIDEIPLWKPKRWRYSTVLKDIDNQLIPVGIDTNDPTTYNEFTQRRDPELKTYYRSQFIYYDETFNETNIYKKIFDDITKFFKDGIIAPYWYNRTQGSRYFNFINNPYYNDPYKGFVSDIIDERAGSYNNPYVSVTPNIDTAIKFLYMALAEMSNYNVGYIFKIESDRGIPITYFRDKVGLNRIYNDNYLHDDEFVEYVIPGEIRPDEIKEIIPIMFNPYLGNDKIGFHLFLPIDDEIINKSIDKINNEISLYIDYNLRQITAIDDNIDKYFKKIRANQNSNKKRYHFNFKSFISNNNQKEINSQKFIFPPPLFH